VPVYVEVSFIAMHALENVIRQPADRENVTGAVEGEGIIRIEPLSREHLLVNALKSAIVGLE
jgi:hypothetical protein